MNNRIKHPSTRADRIELKQKLDEKKPKKVSRPSPIRLFKEAIKFQETQNELLDTSNYAR